MAGAGGILTPLPRPLALRLGRGRDIRVTGRALSWQDWQPEPGLSSSLVWRLNPLLSGEQPGANPSLPVPPSPTSLLFIPSTHTRVTPCSWALPFSLLSHIPAPAQLAGVLLLPQSRCDPSSPFPDPRACSVSTLHKCRGSCSDGLRSTSLTSKFSCSPWRPEPSLSAPDLRSQPPFLPSHHLHLAAESSQTGWTVPVTSSCPPFLRCTLPLMLLLSGILLS